MYPEGDQEPSFDLNVTTFRGERIWVNISSIFYANRRTDKTLLVHLARDISEQKKREEVFRRMVAISKEVSTLEDTISGAAPVTPLSFLKSLRFSGCLRWETALLELPRGLASVRKRCEIISTISIRSSGHTTGLRR